MLHRWALVSPQHLSRRHHWYPRFTNESPTTHQRRLLHLDPLNSKNSIPVCTTPKPASDTSSPGEPLSHLLPGRGQPRGPQFIPGLWASVVRGCISITCKWCRGSRMQAPRPPAVLQAAGVLETCSGHTRAARFGRTHRPPLHTGPQPSPNRPGLLPPSDRSHVWAAPCPHPHSPSRCPEGV